VDVSTSIVDTLPPDVMYVDSSPNGVYSSTARTVTWDVPPLTSDVSGTLTVTVLVPESFAPLGVQTNTVTIAPIDQDTDLANNTQQWFTRVGDGPNLLNDTAKTIDPPITSRGDVVTYTIVIRNTGSVTAATTITDPLPLGVIYQSGSSTVDDAPVELYDAGSNQIRWTGSLDAEDAVVIRFRALIDTYSSVTNTVTIDDGAGLVFERSAANVLPRRVVWLPVVMK
jgi:uncharacterized repeat protein (TIGR01451 family)